MTLGTFLFELPFMRIGVTGTARLEFQMNELCHRSILKAFLMAFRTFNFCMGTFQFKFGIIMREF